MQKKIRVNKEFENLWEAAEYLNYYLNRNPDAVISLADLTRLMTKNGWVMEDQGLDNNSHRTICTDDDGNELAVEMVPRFAVFAPNVEEDPEDEGEEESEEDESEEEDEGEEESEEESEEEETEDEEESEEEDEEPTTEQMFAWVEPGETFVWRDPEDDSEHSAEVVEVKSDDGKVHDSNTEIRAKVEGVDGVISIFCDEIVMEDEEDESEEDEIEDAEIVEDPSDDSDKEDGEG